MTPQSVSKSLVFFGDSFLGRFGKLYITQLEQAVPGVTVYNCAAGGLNTDDGVVRVGYIAQLKPDYVVLSFGANDAAPWKEEIVSPEDFRKNLGVIMEAFTGSRMIMFLCPPANDPADPVETKAFNDAIGPYNDIAKDVAASHGVTVIDSPVIYGQLLARGINYHDMDGLHLNDVGYKVMIDACVSWLQTL